MSDRGSIEFRDVIASSPALLERLGYLDHPERFEAEARAIAGELGIPFVADMLGDMRDDPLGLSRFEHAPVALDRWPTLGWLPARSIPTGGAPAFDWAWFGARRLTESFYEDTVRQVAGRPLSRAFRTRTGLDAVIGGKGCETTLAPDGLVFHMSRCGSTLAAQMLAAAPHHIVVSEAEPIDAVVHWAGASGLAMADQARALRAIVAALGRNRCGSARRYFLKLDAWHILSLPLYRSAFPEIPWVFLYRDPEEVMVSQMRLPGMHFSGGVSGLASPAGASFSREDFGARVLAGLLRAAAEGHAEGGGMLVNYATLAAQMMGEIPAHFGFEPDEREREAMELAAVRDAKAPAQPFATDSQAKRAAVTPAIRDAVSAHLATPFARLEELRRSGASGIPKSIDSFRARTTVGD